MAKRVAKFIFKSRLNLFDFSIIASAPIVYNCIGLWLVPIVVVLAPLSAICENRYTR